MREEDLQALFEDYNLKVVKLNLLKDERGRHKGAGFIEFESVKDADVAVNELNGFLMGNEAIKLSYSKSSLKTSAPIKQ